MKSETDDLSDEQYAVEARQTHVDDFDKLQPLPVHEGIKSYLKSKERDISGKTRQEYRTKLEFFAEYCDSIGLENLNNVNGRVINQFKNWRAAGSSDNSKMLSNKTMQDNLYLLRDFIRHLEKIEAVYRGTAQKVEIPNLKPGEGVRNVELGSDRLEDILDYLATYSYASLEHVVIALCAQSGRRIGGIHSLDLDDVHIDRDNPYIEFIHRGDSETRLKNGIEGEEQVNIDSDLAELLSSYIENTRIEQCVNGRNPLLTTRFGRIGKSTIRSYFYRWTRPCKIGKECPDNREESSCEAACDKDNASKCPASEAPHAARHGYLTEMLRQGVPPEVISDRCDITEEVLREVYDERSTKEKRKSRRSLLEESGVLD